MEKKLTFDVTCSGDMYFDYRLPDGSYKSYHDPETKCISGYWKDYDADQKNSFTINLLNIEHFRKVVFPYIKVEATYKKNINGFKKWWYQGMYWKLFDVKETIVGFKEVTYLKMVSGTTHYVDQKYDDIKQAIDNINII